MTRDEKKIANLMRYGIDLGLAKKLVDSGYSVSKLRTTKISELADDLDKEIARKVKKAIRRPSIPEETFSRLVGECDWSCCMCFNVDQRKHVIVHHIVPFENTQDHSYENLVVLCLEHHSQAHSKSDLSGDLLPPQLIRQKKRDFIHAIGLAKAGKRAWPGREPFPQYSLGELLRNSQHQANAALSRYSNIYDADLYVNRKLEGTYFEFIKSNKTGMLVVDKSGQGKSNFVCELTTNLLADEKIVLLIRGDIDLSDENGLEKLLCQSLGYDTANFQYHLNSIAQTLEQQSATCYVFVDGISESNNLSLANRALSNLLTKLAKLGHFKLCVALRDIFWNRISYDLPHGLLYIASSTEEKDEPRHFLLEMSDDELESGLALYKQKFNVDCELLPIAKNQLKHPLMLRMFFEAYGGMTLGTIHDVPIEKTFDLYLTKKTETIEQRSHFDFRSTLLLRTIRLIAFEMWQHDDAKSIDEVQWQDILKRFGIQNTERLIEELSSEGLIEIEENSITLERKLRLVFDQLREYLLLQYLLTLFPEPVLQSIIDNQDFKALLSFVKRHSKNIDHIKVLSLIGIRLSEIKKRRYFLQDLMRYDFQAFCACLARIPPVGNLEKCHPKFQKTFGSELLRWYKLIAVDSFPNIYKQFDPWDKNPEEPKSIGIDLTVSPECKEIAYHYEPYDKVIPLNKLTKVKGTDRYPTWELAIVHGKEKLLLHNPDKGMIIPIYRGGPNNSVTRTLNHQYFPRFPGDSYNIPERMALYDIWEEIQHLVNNGALPIRPYNLLAEQAWGIASEFTGLVTEGLDSKLFQEKKRALLKKYLASDFESDSARQKLHTLDSLLNILGRPLQSDDYPAYKLQPSINKPIDISNLDDDSLAEYLALIIWGALQAYFSLVEANFPNLVNFLNTYANLPCRLIVVTERTNVKVFLMPVENAHDAECISKVIPGEKFQLTSPEIKLEINSDGEVMDSSSATLKLLKKLGKLRPGIHPIEDVMPIEGFFKKFPMDHLVKQWLLRDLYSLFSL